MAFIETDDKKMKSRDICNSALFAWEKQDHLRMNDSTRLNNHLRSIDRFSLFDSLFDKLLIAIGRAPEGGLEVEEEFKIIDNIHKML